jgi:spoIIIJ-associated protein
MLIGKRGQTLEAMQTLVEKCVNRTGGRRIHVAVDVETYLENRRAGIVRNAKRFAEKVKKNRKPISMGYMNAQDRRTVHLALKDDAGISTQSKGEGYLKKLKIYPRRLAPND